MNKEHSAQILNLSTFLFFASGIPVTVFLAYVIFNSPVTSPILRILAEQAYKKKKYRRAAKLFAKLDFFQTPLEGNQYIKKSALSYELAGSIQEALDAYRKADDWPKVGQLLTELGKIEQAKEVYLEHELYQRLVLLYEMEKNHLQAGKIYLEKRQSVHKAEQSFKRCLESKDAEVFLQARLLLVFVYLEMNRSEEAREQFHLAQSVLQSSVQFEDFEELLQLRDRAEFSLKRHQNSEV